MKINKNIVYELEKKYNCPILEMFYTNDDGYWYVCFEQYICILGKGQTVSLDEVLEEIQKYDNVEYLSNEVYNDDERDNTYFEQITFQWKE